MRRTVAIGLLGVQKDAGGDESRWNRWRPTISLCQHEDLLIDRLELLVQADAHTSKLAEQVTRDLAGVSPETEVHRHDVAFRNPWDFAEVYAVLRDFADAYPFDEENEDYLVHITTGTHVVQICLFLLTETRHFPARLIQTSPPRGRQPGPGGYSIIDLDLSRYGALAARFETERAEGVSFLKNGIATRNPGFNALMDRIEQVSLASDAPILLTGATGVGKTRLAQRIFELKKRHRNVEGQLVEVNCATLRGDTAMSALFGHERGAFTGASTRRAGLLRAAHEGLLFLDEIGELGLDEQATLLRAIEEGVFLPVGSDRPVESRFQLIAGTNRDLSVAVSEGSFREDLLARIDLWSFDLPALKDRPEDIEPNLEWELATQSEASGKRLVIGAAARRRFLSFARHPETTWPGNFRDFNAALTRLVTLSPNGRITAAAVEEEIGRLRTSWARRRSAGTDFPHLADVLGEDAASELDLFDRVQLEGVIDTCRRSATLSDAGRRLFSVSRTKKSSRNDADRLKKYLARFGLAWSDVRA
ncbi:MAG: RNA repair transcriptional activator RtcR [Planctomycetota bacterium]